MKCHLILLCLSFSVGHSLQHSQKNDYDIALRNKSAIDVVNAEPKLTKLGA